MIHAVPTVANYPRYQARELTKAIRSMSPKRKESLIERILFQEFWRDYNACYPHISTHIVTLLQNKQPRTSLERLLRDAHSTSTQFLVTEVHGAQ